MSADGRNRGEELEPGHSNVEIGRSFKLEKIVEVHRVLEENYVQDKLVMGLDRRTPAINSSILSSRLDPLLLFRYIISRWGEKFGMHPDIEFTTSASAARWPECIFRS